MTGIPDDRRTEAVVFGDVRSRGANWVVFGGVMLVLVGTVHAIQGVVALVNDDFYATTEDGLTVSVDYTVWGWVHLLMGLTAAAVGIGLFAGNRMARVAGVLFAGLSAVVNLAFISAYPVYTVLVVTLDVIVIYAIVVHGDELRAPSY
jgi:hypothetical protein